MAILKRDKDMMRIPIQLLCHFQESGRISDCCKQLWLYTIADGFAHIKSMLHAIYCQYKVAKCRGISMVVSIYWCWLLLCAYGPGECHLTMQVFFFRVFHFKLEYSLFSHLSPGPATIHVFCHWLAGLW
jgi:hypothetical protein